MTPSRISITANCGRSFNESEPKHLIAPVANVFENQQAQDNFSRCALPAAAATFGMPLPQSVVDGAHQVLVLKHLVGVDHPILAEIFYLPVDQSVAEAELRAPHFNHGSSSGSLTQLCP